MKYWLVLVSFIASFVGVEAQSIHSHTTWNSLLKAHVSTSGKVDYAGLKKKEATLDKYLSELASNSPSSAWSGKKEMAYWINAYNACTVKLILDHYPVSSIMKIHGGKAWDKKFIKIGGKSYSLNQIEHKILRPKFKDARIHFAVNCAAKSCPPLLNRAFVASRLDQQLDSQTRKFINNTKYNQLSKNKMAISKIFEWYAEDFGAIQAYINKYSKTKVSATKPTYNAYNWQLNGK